VPSVSSADPSALPGTIASQAETRRYFGSKERGFRSQFPVERADGRRSASTGRAFGRTEALANPTEALATPRIFPAVLKILA
jgi:hypothetical protein